MKKITKNKIKNDKIKNNLLDFISLLNTLIKSHVPPSTIFKNFTGGQAYTPGQFQMDRNKKIIWTRQQDAAIKTIETHFKNLQSLRLSLPGCLGSGKTLLLVESIRKFCEIIKTNCMDICYWGKGHVHGSVALENLVKIKKNFIFFKIFLKFLPK